MTNESAEQSISRPLWDFLLDGENSLSLVGQVMADAGSGDTMDDLVYVAARGLALAAQVSASVSVEHVGVYTLDRRGYRILDVSDALCAMAGMSREEMVGRLFFETFQHPSAALIRARFDDALRTGEQVDFSIEYEPLGIFHNVCMPSVRGLLVVTERLDVPVAPPLDLEGEDPPASAVGDLFPFLT